MTNKITYEYLTRYKGANEITEMNMAAFLNAMGLEGWELVQVIVRNMINNPTQPANYTFIFKRVITK